MKQTLTIAVLFLVLALVVAGCANSSNTDAMSKDDSKGSDDGAMTKDESAGVEKSSDADMTKTESNIDSKTDSTEAMGKTESSIESSSKTTQSSQTQIQGTVPEPMASYNGNILAGKTSPYIEFNKPDYDAALNSNKKILLYFYASWCPLCRAEQPETFAAFNELNDANLIGFRVNYKDSATDSDEEALAREFGVSYQHTKVIIKDGQRVLKAPDSWNKQRYLDELAKI